MKICLIGPGMMPIPPEAWGAVEILMWDYHNQLIKRGHEVDIINTKNLGEIIEESNKGDYDVVHLHYDVYASIMPHIKCPKKLATSHYPFLENPEPQYTWIYRDLASCGCHMIALSDNIKKCFTDRGFDESIVSVLPNGVDTELYHFKESDLLHADKSIYLAKVEPRKRQTLVQGEGLNIHFAGKLADPKFVREGDEYIGELTKKEIYKSLTEYANMILLSKAEAHPVVCIEALAAGLGLVISEHCTAHLDLSKPFISVIEEDKLTDVDHIKSVIEDNRQASLSMRSEIREYGKENFDWDNIILKYEAIIEGVRS